jgi:hypothetical protein
MLTTGDTVRGNNTAEQHQGGRKRIEKADDSSMACTLVNK